jgi:YesN/AraC family two-component response regulator
MVTTLPCAPFSILLVEDDAIVCLAISRILTREFPDSTVYTANNGPTGLELFKKYTPEIVITDINMPVMDGIEMAGEIKFIRTDTKFIVVTGHFDRNYLERFGKIGFVDYLVKPIDFNKLFAAIEKCRAGITVGS